MAETARGRTRHLGAFVPEALIVRIDREIKRDGRWSFGNRSRAVRTLLDEALDARARARKSRKREVA
jgi:Arc/MetJ-type ribon-helix-helix transcriptional regulator